jgi:short-subunit dehydrogenase
MYTTYSATKAFNAAYSDALAMEVDRPQGGGGSEKRGRIAVLTATPSMVLTQLAVGGAEAYAHARPSFMCVDAGEMARATLGNLGVVARAAGHPHHELLEAVLGALPHCVTTALLMGGQRAGRAAGLKAEAATEITTQGR